MENKSKQKFKTGDSVLGLWMDGCKYPAKILSINSDGTITIKYTQDSVKQITKPEALFQQQPSTNIKTKKKESKRCNAITTKKTIAGNIKEFKDIEQIEPKKRKSRCEGITTKKTIAGNLRELKDIEQIKQNEDLANLITEKSKTMAAKELPSPSMTKTKISENFKKLKESQTKPSEEQKDNWNMVNFKQKKKLSAPRKKRNKMAKPYKELNGNEEIKSNEEMEGDSNTDKSKQMAVNELLSPGKTKTTTEYLEKLKEIETKQSEQLEDASNSEKSKQLPALELLDLKKMPNEELEANSNIEKGKQIASKEMPCSSKSRSKKKLKELKDFKETKPEYELDVTSNTVKAIQMPDKKLSAPRKKITKKATNLKELKAIVETKGNNDLEATSNSVKPKKIASGELSASGNEKVMNKRNFKEIREMEGKMHNEKQDETSKTENSKQIAAEGLPSPRMSKMKIVDNFKKLKKIKTKLDVEQEDNYNTKKLKQRPAKELLAVRNMPNDELEANSYSEKSKEIAVKEMPCSSKSRSKRKLKELQDFKKTMPEDTSKTVKSKPMSTKEFSAPWKKRINIAKDLKELEAIEETKGNEELNCTSNSTKSKENATDELTASGKKRHKKKRKFKEVNMIEERMHNENQDETYKTENSKTAALVLLTSENNQQENTAYLLDIEEVNTKKQLEGNSKTKEWMETAAEELNASKKISLNNNENLSIETTNTNEKLEKGANIEKIKNSTTEGLLALKKIMSRKAGNLKKLNNMEGTMSTKKFEIFKTKNSKKAGLHNLQNVKKKDNGNVGNFKKLKEITERAIIKPTKRQTTSKETMDMMTNKMLDTTEKVEEIVEAALLEKNSVCETTSCTETAACVNHLNPIMFSDIEISCAELEISDDPLSRSNKLFGENDQSENIQPYTSNGSQIPETNIINLDEIDDSDKDYTPLIQLLPIPEEDTFMSPEHPTNEHWIVFSQEGSEEPNIYNFDDQESQVSDENILMVNPDTQPELDFETGYNSSSERSEFEEACDFTVSKESEDVINVQASLFKELQTIKSKAYENMVPEKQHSDTSSAMEDESEGSLYNPSESNSSESDTEDCNIKHQKHFKDSNGKSEKITVVETNNSTSRSYDKKYHCVFCQKVVAKIARHLESQHKNEQEVALIMAEKNRKKRRQMWTTLRNKGNHLHNVEVFEKGTGTIEVVHRPNSSVPASSFIPCQFCYGYYSKTELWRHRCVAKDFEKKKMQRNQWVSSGRMLLPTPMNIPDILKDILSKMKIDTVNLLIKNDATILELGRKMVVRHGDSQHAYIKNRLRELGRFVLELRKQKKFENCQLDDVLHPEHFQEIMIAVRGLCGYEHESTKFNKPSLALKIGYSIKTCLTICKARCIQDGSSEDLKRYDALHKLFEMEFADEVSSNALKTMYRRKQNNPKMLPLTEDVQRLQMVLKKNIADSKNVLQKASKCSFEEVAKAHSTLNESTLASLIIFNRRRSGEVSKMKVTEYSNMRDHSTRSEIESALPSIEQSLCKILSRIEILGKRGTLVPVLLTQEIREAINVLLKNRKYLQIPDANPYLFARIRHGSLGHIRGCDSLRKYAKECQATEPKYLTSTRLRKHVATYSQLLNLKENELDMLAKFMGHDIRVHREFYRLPDDTVQIAKVSKIFLALENGTLGSQQGKSLSEIDVNIDNSTEIECDDHDDELIDDDDDSEDADSDDAWDDALTGNTIPCKKTKKENKANSIAKVRSVKQKWSDDEQAAVFRHFKRIINSGQLPGKKQILECLQVERDILKNRSWTNVKDFCRNKIIAKARSNDN